MGLGLTATTVTLTTGGTLTAVLSLPCRANLFISPLIFIGGVLFFYLPCPTTKHFSYFIQFF